MAPSFDKMAAKALDLLNPEKSAGKTLMVLDALGIAFAAASNTFAAATDKNTSAEDKKFLVPAGAATGFANVAIYLGMTTKIIDKLAGRNPELISPKKLSKMSEKEVKSLGGFADKIIDSMLKNNTYEQNADKFINSKILKGSKKYSDIATVLKNEDGSLTPYAKNMFRENIRGGLGVVGAFIGAVVGCAIITPILRDVSAYAVQKAREAKDPSLKNKPYRPYFDISHIRPNGSDTKPNHKLLSMTNYMAFTNGSMKV